jgi:hypothetical protein
MSDLGIQPREVRDQTDGLLAESRPSSLENTSKQRRFFVLLSAWSSLNVAFGDL